MKKLKEKKSNLIYKILNKDENNDKGKKKDINNEENINDSHKINLYPCDSTLTYV